MNAHANIERQFRQPSPCNTRWEAVAAANASAAVGKAEQNASPIVLNTKPRFEPTAARIAASCFANAGLIAPDLGTRASCWPRYLKRGKLRYRLERLTYTHTSAQKESDRRNIPLNHPEISRLRSQSRRLREKIGGLWVSRRCPLGVKRVALAACRGLPVFPCEQRNPDQSACLKSATRDMNGPSSITRALPTTIHRP